MLDHKLFRSFLLGIVIGICLIVSLVHRHSPYELILHDCRSGDQASFASCVNKASVEVQTIHPEKTGEFWNYISHHARQYQAIDLRYFSDYGHFAGMSLAKKNDDLNDAMNTCGDTFKSACAHGFVMERLDEQQINSNKPANLLNYCLPVQDVYARYINCIHGVGHEIMAKTTQDLPHTLNNCSVLNRFELINACASGVFMEYSKGDPNKGKHSHLATGAKELPCSSVPKIYKEVCYSSSGSYRQYYPNQESPKTSYESCAMASSEYISICMSAVSERLLMAVGGNPKLAQINCQNLPAYLRIQCGVSVETFGKGVAGQHVFARLQTAN